MDLVRRWWSQGDRYDWIIAYLQEHQLIAGFRLVLAVGNVSLSVTLAALTASKDGPHDPTATAVAYLCAAVGISVLVIWAPGVPSRRGSICFAVVCTAGFIGASVVQTNPLIGLILCAALTCIAGYVAFFHSPRWLLASLVVTAAVASISAIRLAASGHIALAGGVFWVVMVINFGGPIGIQILVHTLGIDLLQADRDPLTGLLNRRSFGIAVRQLIREHGADHRYLAVVMIDLDRFKVLNDTHGHAVGDQALIDVATALQTHTRPEAIVARAGGEEFLVADVVRSPESTGLGERIRAAIASGPYGTTASVGTATAPLHGIDEDTVQSVIVHLTSAADLAMYQAKRDGGNQVRCAELDIERS